MSKCHHLLVLILAVCLCFASAWRVFPLPDQPVKSIPTLFKPTVITAQSPGFSKGFSKENGFGNKPSSLFNSSVSKPSRDLLPPKNDVRA
ncbi:hypothetical protein evm_000965 [Chilo suppressalis]|nr:hypothetical protein evm_000965 [Chilo suppressalis]